MTLSDESVDARAPAQRAGSSSGPLLARMAHESSGSCGSELDRRLTHGIELRSAPITTAVLGP